MSLLTSCRYPSNLFIILHHGVIGLVELVHFPSALQEDGGCLGYRRPSEGGTIVGARDRIELCRGRA